MEATFRRFAMALFFTACAAGHDLYLLPDRFLIEKGAVLSFGIHNGDAFPESEASPAMERLRDVVLHSSTGAAEAEHLHVDGKRAIGTAAVSRPGDLILTARTIPNFIQLEPDKFEDYLKEEGLTDVIAWRASHGEARKPGRERYSKYAKALLLAGTPDGYYDHQAGFAIEIVPEKDPYLLKPGEQLPVKVLFQGKPAAGLSMEAAWAGPQGKGVQRVGTTDSQGRIVVPLRAAGRWRLHTIKMERCTEPAVADWESSWASLTFELR
jgi:Domain of unknown function (DUF4198)